MIIEVNYMALQYDNYQGGSGRPIRDRFVFEEDDSITLEAVAKIAFNKLTDLVQEFNGSVFGHAKIIDIRIINDDIKVFAND